MTQANDTGGAWFRSRTASLMFVVVGVIGLYLVIEHSTHVIAVLPYLVLLACPLMHFLHRGHGHHGGHKDGPTSSK